MHPYEDDFAFDQGTGPGKEGISETFADLLAAQGYKEQAMEMYLKLMEKYPEKSGFFAAKIEALQQLIISFVMLKLITILIALICILLMAVILIQNPKGGGVDSTFGGQSANQMFGAAKSVDFIEKLTWGLAAALFSLCIFASFFVK